MLADILAGPILRRVTTVQLVFWWVSPFVCHGQLQLFEQGELFSTLEFDYKCLPDRHSRRYSPAKYQYRTPYRNED